AAPTMRASETSTLRQGSAPRSACSGARLARRLGLAAARNCLAAHSLAAVLAGELHVRGLAGDRAAWLAGAGPGVVSVGPGDARAAVGSDRDAEVVEQDAVVAPVERVG